MDFVINGWKKVVEKEVKKEYFVNLWDFVEFEYQNKEIFPPKEQIFQALIDTDLTDVKVLILGQDPYHDYGQAHGLAFSVQPEQKVPKSLQNIYKELHEDLGLTIPNHGYLNKWAKQGVLLLNTVLTVEAHQANSHKNKGWEIFTDQLLLSINNIKKPIVIMLWGKPAARKRVLLNNPNHLIIETTHPSPLSAYRGFLGSKCFSKCNDYLEKHGISPIDWQIEEINN